MQPLRNAKLLQLQQSVLCQCMFQVSLHKNEEHTTQTLNFRKSLIFRKKKKEKRKKQCQNRTIKVCTTKLKFLNLNSLYFSNFNTEGLHIKCCPKFSGAAESYFSFTKSH